MGRRTAFLVILLALVGFWIQFVRFIFTDLLIALGVFGVLVVGLLVAIVDAEREAGAQERERVPGAEVQSDLRRLHKS